MAYSKFTLPYIKEKYGIKVRQRKLFTEEIQAFQPSEWLKTSLQKASESVRINTEKAKSELITAPIFVEISLANADKISVFSGDSLNVTDDLCGEIDFMMSAIPDIIEIEAPVFSVVEMKYKFPDDGLGQCIGQMIGARELNEVEKKKFPYIYGCLTNGFDWRFLKLEGDFVYEDPSTYQIHDLPHLLGILQWIINRFV